MAIFSQSGNYKPKKVPMKTDSELHNKLKPPLSSIKSGCFVCICGSAGSGKSSILINLFKKLRCEQTGLKMGLNKCFDHIFIVSPSMNSFNKNIFENIGDEYKFDNLLEFLDNYREVMQGDDNETCIIFDDIGSQIRTKECLNKFNKLIHNRRHQHLTIFMLVQNLSMVVPAIRDSINILISFKPKSIEEKELIFSLSGLPKKDMNEFYKFFFKEKHDSLLIDMTLITSDDYVFYRNIFNEVKIATGPQG